jgi:hypothetical protein
LKTLRSTAEVTLNQGFYMKLLSLAVLGLLLAQSNAFAQGTKLKVGQVLHPVASTCVDRKGNIVESDGKTAIPEHIMFTSLKILALDPKMTRIELKATHSDSYSGDIGYFTEVLELTGQNGAREFTIVSSTLNGVRVDREVASIYHYLPAELKIVDGLVVAVPQYLNHCNPNAKLVARDGSEESPIDWDSEISLSAEEAEIVNSNFFNSYKGPSISVEPSYASVVFR